MAYALHHYYANGDVDVSYLCSETCASKYARACRANHWQYEGGYDLDHDFLCQKCHKIVRAPQGAYPENYY